MSVRHLGCHRRRSNAAMVAAIGVAFITAACEVAEPEPSVVHIRGQVVSSEDLRPVSAVVQLEHEVGDGDPVWTSYRTVIDASVETNADGRYDLEHRPQACTWFDLRIEADGFIPYVRRLVPCADSVQTVDVELDPGFCVPDIFGCRWVPHEGIRLRTPVANATITQNDPSIGCPAHPTRGHGFEIRFTWHPSNYGGVAAYRLTVTPRGTNDRLIDVFVTEPEFTSLHCNTFVPDGDLEDWTWIVREVAASGRPLRRSPIGEFRFDPCRLASGGECAARSPGQPAERILIDASHGGGVWWFPQYGTYDPAVTHQGKRLADRLRGMGYEVDELRRDVVVTDSLLDRYSKVVRVNGLRGYQAGELDAYARFLERETTLLLLSDGPTAWGDDLSDMLGLTFAGEFTDSITSVAPHPVTGGLLGLRLAGGVTLSEFDPDRVELLAWVPDGPVMGTLRFANARIIFLGEVNFLQSVPRPFADHLLTWLVL